MCDEEEEDFSDLPELDPIDFTADAKNLSALDTAVNVPTKDSKPSGEKDSKPSGKKEPSKKKEPELPDGVAKEILNSTRGAGFKKPKVGDEVTVHYVGKLQANDKEFDSSRARGKPFVFTLGKGQVIKGWDLGVATMKKGETAKFTLAPEFAYGDSGSPPRIPKQATLVFEVELLSWVTQDDLFGDDGAIKIILTDGSGFKTPKEDDQVVVSVKAIGENGVTIEDRRDEEYTLGSGALGLLGKVCDKAIMSMKRGEEAEVRCSKSYAYPGKGKTTIKLTLKELYDTEDCSFTRDESVMKKQIKEGDGYASPQDNAKVKISILAATDGSSPLPGFKAQVLEFRLGNGEVCDILECVVVEMRKCEKAIVTVNKTSLINELQLGMRINAARIVLTVVLLEFEKTKDPDNMAEEEKIEYATARKEVATRLFKDGRAGMALERYKLVSEMFEYWNHYRDENIIKVKELVKSCKLNKTACLVKLEDWAGAKEACNTILQDDKRTNTILKATYRRAQAELGLNNFPECILDCKRVMDMDPQNKDVRTLLKQAQNRQKEVDKTSAGTFANMCKALGKGPKSEIDNASRETDASNVVESE